MTRALGKANFHIIILSSGGSLGKSLNFFGVALPLVLVVVGITLGLEGVVAFEIDPWWMLAALGFGIVENIRSWWN
jgi:hypothetical protein